LHRPINLRIVATIRIMRNATPLKPRDRPARTAAEVARWKKARTTWVDSLDPALQFHRLFDHIPGAHFFAKRRDGHLMFASRGLLQRYQMRDDSEFIGRTDFDLNPEAMAKAYVDDDKRILSGRAAMIERIELWWDRQGMPDWFLVTKLPLYDRRKRIQGVVGVLRRPDEAERRLPVFQTVAQAVEIIRRDFAKPLRIEDVARQCGQSLRQLQRRFRGAFAITPQEFLMRTRVLAAARLLETTALTSGEIAAQCGFVDQSSFTQHFRKRIGASPAAHRRGVIGQRSTVNGSSTGPC
jgi:AraC-like DNA-binding protein